MKIRNGFVSNSSSSSFVVVVKKPQKDETNYLEIIDFMMKHHYEKKTYDKNFSLTIKEYADNLEIELKSLAKDLSFIEGQKCFLEALLKDKNLIKPIGGLLKYLSQKSCRGTSPNISFAREYCKGKPEAYLTNEIKSLEYDLDKLKAKIEDCNLRLNNVKNYNDAAWKIMGFEEDVMFGYISTAIKELEEKGLASILTRKTT